MPCQTGRVSGCRVSEGTDTTIMEEVAISIIDGLMRVYFAGCILRNGVLNPSAYKVESFAERSTLGICGIAAPD